MAAHHEWRTWWEVGTLRIRGGWRKECGKSEWEVDALLIVVTSWSSAKKQSASLTIHELVSHMCCDLMSIGLHGMNTRLDASLYGADSRVLASMGIFGHTCS